MTKGWLDFCRNSYFMIYFASLILCGVFYLLKSDVVVLNQLAEKISNFCLDNVPNQSTHLHFHQAILCGSRFSADPLAPLFQQTNLIHHLVVSGSHALLAWTLLRGVSKKWPQLVMTVYFIFILFLLALTGFQPPLLRFLIFFLFRKFSFFKDNSPFLTEFFLTLGLLTCFPGWSHSYSFYLSSMAALALQISGHPLLHQRTVWKQTCFFLILYFPLMQLGGSNPLGIVYNLLASPIFAILLPMEYLTMIFPKLIAYVDIFLDSFFLLLQKFSESPAQVKNIWKDLSFSLWLYWCFVLLLGHFGFMIYLRQNIQFQQKKIS